MCFRPSAIDGNKTNNIQMETCPSCGEPVAASITSGTCPHCGNAIPAKTSTDNIPSNSNVKII